MKILQIVKCRCPFAVPEKIFGLTPFLDFFDRCTRCALALSATGGAQARGQDLTIRFSLPETDSKKSRPQKGSGFFGAGDRDRTGTLFRARDFKSLVSACSTTPAVNWYFNTVF